MGRIKEISRRPTRSRKRNPVVYLICEGSETEIRHFMHISVQERRLYGVLATLSRSKATQPYIQEPKFHLHEQIGPPCRNV